MSLTRRRGEGRDKFEDGRKPGSLAALLPSSPLRRRRRQGESESPRRVQPSRLSLPLPTTMSINLSPLASLSQLRSTPSRQDGIPADLEDDLRMYGAQLIQEAGRLCQL